tara:strand:+ start:5451 stop:5798 length:348 start_codon:yes stop_codon:yes gene_type:complete
MRNNNLNYEVTKMKLNELYRELTVKPNSPLSFIANVIFTNYNSSRKQMLQGLYNIVNGGPRHYWNPCEVAFASFSMETIIATPRYTTNRTADGREIEGYLGSCKEIDIKNLRFYA